MVGETSGLNWTKVGLKAGNHSSTRSAACSFELD